MPYEIRLDGCPAGYSLQSGQRGGVVDVAYREFTSSEDGNLFVSRLEGFPRQLIAAIPGATIAEESTVNHLLAIIRSDQSATLYLNDLPFTVETRAKGPIKAGQAVTADDILDVTRIRLKGIVVPADAGIVAIFSVGWRKGLFFDFEPLRGIRRLYDIEPVLGQYYAYLAFQHMFSIPDPIWNEFFSQRWFPFISLKQSTIRQMIGIASSGNVIDDLLDTISSEMQVVIGHQLDAWKSHPLLGEHHQVIKAAHERFSAGDFISAVSNLFPRIEGIMRSHHLSTGATDKATQESLTVAVTGEADLRPHANSLLLPNRFQRFLREVYFANFDPKTPSGLSRNTVAHGVAPTNALDKKGAVLGFLILLQIVALLPGRAAGQTP